MAKRYEVPHATGYVRGTKQQVSAWLCDLNGAQRDEAWHLREGAAARAWNALAPSQREAWLEKARAWQEEHPPEPGDSHWPALEEARSQFEAKLSTQQWQAFIGEAAPRALVPWVVHADTDKAHRCPRCGSAAGLMDEMDTFGHPGVNQRHAYQCTRCNQRLRYHNGLPDFDTGIPVWFPRLRWRLHFSWRYGLRQEWKLFRRDCREYGVLGAARWQFTWRWELTWDRRLRRWKRRLRRSC